MSDDRTFRQERKQKIDPNEFRNNTPSLDDVLNMQRQAGVDIPNDVDKRESFNNQSTPQPLPQAGTTVKGNLPPAMQAMLREKAAEQGVQQFNEPVHDTMSDHQALMSRSGGTSQSPMRQMSTNEFTTNDPNLNALLGTLNTQNYEPVTLPSRGKFYNTPDTPSSGEVYLRPMTGQEETILSTVRFMRGGKGIEMIFRNCLQNKTINPEKLLSVDRTYLLIYLRGISYGNLYEVSVKCPDCGNQFDYDIDLNLPVEYCKDDFDSNCLTKVLPSSKMYFKYRLQNGADETEITAYKERKSRFTNSIDDSFLFKASTLIEEIGNDTARITSQRGIQSLLERLPVVDVNFIRNAINDPPFGVNTEVNIVCNNCGNEFGVELPYEANFFFPKEKTELPQ